ncbi:MAG TPA: S8 family serine peptidase [Fimbriimonadaceae bacterium]|nr:S8 family serine peptidase [Fimbriimonadaceae bacterium]
MRVAAALLVLAFGHLASASPQTPRDAFEPIHGEREFSGTLLVHPISTEATSAALRSLPTLPESSIPALNLFVVRVPPGQTERTYAARIMETGLFDYAEPNWRLQGATIPDDPRYPQQWHLTKIDAPRAWDRIAETRPFDPRITIAIVDSGIDKTHEDLGSFVPGYHQPSNTPEVLGGQVSDVAGHGTRVAGVAAAIGNNATGVTGIAWNFQIMPVRVTDSPANNPTQNQVLAGVVWAAQNGAKIVNASYGSPNTASVAMAGTTLRSTYGALLVWSAGNGAQYLTGEPTDVIVVGATDPNDQRAAFSNYGPCIDVAAPGTGILTTRRGGGYVFDEGTSLAAPIVAGALGLIWAYRPNLTAGEVETHLYRGCTDIGDLGEDDTFGRGRVNLRASLLTCLKYKITPLLPLAGSGYTGSQALSINRSSEICGWSEVGPSTEGTIWSGSTTTLTGRLGWHSSQIYEINELGHAVGAALGVPQAYTQTDPIYWNGLTLVALPNPGEWQLGAHGINRHDQIVGFSVVNGQVGTPYYWASPTANAQPMSTGGSGTGIAQGISDDGLVVGYLGNGFTSWRACYWPSPTADPVLLGLIDGYSNRTTNLPDSRGTFTGSCSGPATYTPCASRGAVGFVLPTLPGKPRGYVASINELGFMVGANHHEPPVTETQMRATIWYNFEPIDLNDLVDPSSGSGNWVLYDAVKLTENAQIVGTGLLDGVRTAFLATPFEDSGQAGLTVNCSVILTNSAVAADTPVTFEVTRAGTGQFVGSYTATRDPDTGRYHLLGTSGLRGQYSIRARAEHWLAKRCPEVYVSDFGTEGADFILVNGDIDGNNLIDSDDFDLLVANFGTAGPTGDLDGSGLVESDDFDILVENFGRSGDD